jgi:hypothetical protein
MNYSTLPDPTLHYPTYQTLAIQPMPTLPDPTLLGYSIIHQRLIASELLWGTRYEWLANLSLVYVALHQRLIASELLIIVTKFRLQYSAMKL